MYVVYIMDHIHHLLSESKKWKVAYIWDRREYIHQDSSRFNSKHAPNHTLSKIRLSRIPIEIVGLTNFRDSPPSPPMSSSNVPDHVSTNPNLHHSTQHYQRQTNLLVHKKLKYTPMSPLKSLPVSPNLARTV